MAITHPHPDLLEAGLYTVPEAAALLDFDTKALRRWTAGVRGRSRPVVRSALGKVEEKSAVTFPELMELRLLTELHKAGVSLRDIRAIVADARELLNHPHPFATRTFFRTDGRNVIAEIVGNKRTDMYNLRSKNFEMIDVIEPSLKDDFKFDAQGNIFAWYPRRKIAPNVMIHPKFSFGAPALEKSRIPTATLAATFSAEGNAEVVADIFDLTVDEVNEAVDFEASLGRAA